ncbi:hypothetical protein PoB_003574100 [Plakobranchus ocellatus]|uniref:Uncharacterized protein n=1 Tax=Plakobranchus ocellatus TaxID=259542 RepID=A0AAV4ADI1_9GAST|nr:hypothetical protein PoB_003574100 [Plakobranchus ocellatus]
MWFLWPYVGRWLGGRERERGVDAGVSAHTCMHTTHSHIPAWPAVPLLCLASQVLRAPRRFPRAPPLISSRPDCGAGPRSNCPGLNQRRYCLGGNSPAAVDTASNIKALISNNNKP